MKYPASFRSLNVLILAFVFLVTIPSLFGQAAPKQPMAEEVFTNIKSLKGLTANEFMETMGFFSASLREKAFVMDRRKAMCASGCAA